MDQLRLPVVLRSYRTSEVDEALAVLRNRIAELEETSQPAVIAPTSRRPPSRRQETTTPWRRHLASRR